MIKITQKKSFRIFRRKQPTLTTLTIIMEINMANLTQATADAIGETFVASVTSIGTKIAGLQPPIDDTKLQAGLAAAQALDASLAAPTAPATPTA